MMRNTIAPWCLYLGLWGLGAGCGVEALNDQICRSGDVRCLEQGVEICNEIGTGWNKDACAADQACVQGECQSPDECPDTCKDVICEPHASTCGDDHIFRYECDETGTEMCFAETCIAPPGEGICSGGECVELCDVEQKSYMGCEYFAVDLDNADVYCGYDHFGQIRYCDAAEQQFSVVVSNPHPTRIAFAIVSKGEIGAEPDVAGQCHAPSLPENFVQAVRIPPQGLAVINLPADRGVNATVKDFLAWRIKSNLPITAYQFNPLENVEVYSNDAALLLPTTAAGTEYVVMTREQSFDSLKGYVTVVGLLDKTTVEFWPTTRTQAGPDLPALAPQGFKQPPSSSVEPSALTDLWTRGCQKEQQDKHQCLVTTLDRFEVLNVATDFIGGDLTGSTLFSSAPVIVFGGSEAANAPNTSRCSVESGQGFCLQDPSVPCGCDEEAGPGCSPHAACSALITCCADHLEQQLLPLNLWGWRYVAAHSMQRGNEKEIWRVLAAYNKTQVTIRDVTNNDFTVLLAYKAASIDLDTVLPGEVVLQAGEWFEFETTADFIIEADEQHPILLGQFLAAEHAPFPGMSQGDAGIGDPAFILNAPIRQWRQSYVFLVPDKYAQDFISVVMPATDTECILDTIDLEQHPLRDATTFGDWHAVRTQVTDGIHSISCTAPVYVMVHGYDEYVSYGYPAGMNLEKVIW